MNPFLVRVRSKLFVSRLFGQNRVRSRRRRTRFGAALPAAALVFEVLEQRTLLAATVGIDISPDRAVPGQEVAIYGSYVAGDVTGASTFNGTFAEYFGATLVGRTTVRLSRPTDGIWVGNDVQIVGADNNQAAIETNGGIIYFDSLASSQGESGDPTGRINGATVLADGSVIWVGQSSGNGRTNQPTRWSSPTSPTQPHSFGQLISGEISDIAVSGTYVGTTGFNFAAYSNTTDDNWQLLPGFTAARADDVSANESFIAGSYLWRDYNVLSTSNFDFSQTNDTAPDWRGVETDAEGNPYFAGEYFSLETFSSEVGFWNLDGEFLGSVGNTFADFAVGPDGEVIAAVNGIGGDGFVVRMRDMATLSVSTLIGSPATFTDKGLFAKDGKLGLLLQDAGGAFFTVFDTNAGDSGEPPANFYFDFDGDGTTDEIVTSQNSAEVSYAYNRTGTYNATVIAKTPDGVEVGRATSQIVVSSWKVVEVDGEQVLMIGANQERGSRILVHGFGSRFSVSVDRDRGRVAADRVELIGSNRNDAVTLIGPFSATLDLKGGNDRLTSIRVDVVADLGGGNDRATAIRGGSVSLIGGAGSDRITSIGHRFAFLDGGDGNDLIVSLGFSSLIVGGRGADRILTLETHSVVVTGQLDSDPALTDLVFAELGRERPRTNYLSGLLAPLTNDDGARDTGLQWSLSGLLLAGTNDRVTTPRRGRR